MIDYRDAEAGDAATLAALFARSFTDTFGSLYDPADLTAFLAGHTARHWAAQLADPAYAIRIGEADGTAAALIKLGPPSLPVERTRPSIELRQLYVLSEHKGTGAAQAAMDWAIEAARTRGAQDLFLSVYVDNHRARRFYERYGFERVGSYHFMVGAHADEDDLMKLAL
jgi:GNAT superfamily N-acetyltransferase